MKWNGLSDKARLDSWDSLDEASRQRLVLTTQELTLACAKTFCEKSVDEACPDKGEYTVREIMFTSAWTIAENNINRIYEFAASPIELIFLNSLLFMFLKNSPAGLVILSPVPNAPATIKEWRENYSKLKGWWEAYCEENASGGLANFRLWLESFVSRGVFSSDVADDMYTEVMMYVHFRLENAFHVILQGGLPEIVVNKRSIRPDMFVWVPQFDQMKLVVECDGYEFHRSKEVFESDRRRDRALRAAGYDIFRFGGSEIYHSNIEMVDSLYSYLFQQWDPFKL